MEAKESEKKCAWCHKPFEPRFLWQRFCKPGCKNAWWAYHRPVVRTGRGTLTRRDKRQKRLEQSRVTRVTWADVMKWLTLYSPRLILRLAAARSGVAHGSH